MNKTLNDSMKRVSRSGIALLVAAVAPLSLVSTACMDDAVDEAAPEVADVELAASVDDADVADKKANADLLADCSVHGDGRLYCGNAYFAPIYRRPNTNELVDHMLTTYSWFDCWVRGAPHEGRNNTWYHTVGDQHGADGFMPAFYVFTSSEFDEHPDWHGLGKCSDQVPQLSDH